MWNGSNLSTGCRVLEAVAYRNEVTSLIVHSKTRIKGLLYNIEFNFERPGSVGSGNDEVSRA